MQSLTPRASHMFSYHLCHQRMNEKILLVLLTEDSSFEQYIERVEQLVFAPPAGAAQGREIDILFQHCRGLQDLPHARIQKIQACPYQIGECCRYALWRCMDQLT